MANLLHSKGTRNKILSRFPTNDFGNDGDIVIVSAKGRGVYLCTKSGNRWHAANKLQDLQKLEKTSLKDLKLEKLRIGGTTITNGEYDVSSGDFTLDVTGEIELNTDGGQVTVNDGAASHFKFDCDGTQLIIYDDANAADMFTIRIGAEGATTISTTDADTIVGHLTLQPDGDLILNPKEGKFIAQKDGTEFSAADSAYAGMILGYTHLQPSSSSTESHALQTSFTVEDSTHQVRFIVPPSGKVEIEATAMFNRTSTSDVTIYAGLSDNATYNSLGVGYEYDYSGVLSDDESDDEIVTFKWCVTGLTAGTDTTYHIGFKSSDASAVYLIYGIRSTHGLAHHPFIIKATALPATIYDGS